MGIAPLRLQQMRLLPNTEFLDLQFWLLPPTPDSGEYSWL
ncbi:unnamed protein product [Protopolystoma xenopodis]|uniref:Uncharacterized protein n=1 Tax=Protopolystoma xenopodis TaxID=117903 RepID=A0A3S5AIN6_9PLAT|nr:unnamed protein product [Protopolystoma xenopodis]